MANFNAAMDAIDTARVGVYAPEAAQAQAIKERMAKVQKYARQGPKKQQEMEEELTGLSQDILDLINAARAARKEIDGGYARVVMSCAAVTALCADPVLINELDDAIARLRKVRIDVLRAGALEPTNTVWQD